MSSTEKPDEDEELPRIRPIVNKETARRWLTRIQIMKLLEEDNPSEWEPGQTITLPCNTLS